MTTEMLERAFAGARHVLSGVSRQQMSATTPCASWSVRDLVNHMVSGSYFLGLTAEAGEAQRPPEEDFAGGDFLGRYDQGSARSLAVFGRPEVQSKMIKLPFGELPGAVFMRIGATDHLAHAWDLARATGQPTDLDPELAEQLLENARAALAPELRGPDGKAPFGPERQAPPGAPAADRLAAFLGRAV
jgi:uncharacterized protein (TIGR03086 family)